MDCNKWMKKRFLQRNFAKIHDKCNQARDELSDRPNYSTKKVKRERKERGKKVERERERERDRNLGTNVTINRTKKN